VTFELMTAGNRIEAVLLATEVPPEQIKEIYRILPEHYRLFPLLSKRWHLWGVITHEDWHIAQLARIPMTRPKKTLRLSFSDMEARAASFPRRD